MKYIFTSLLLFISFIVLVGQVANVTYTASNDDFVNPDRGFYSYSDTRTSNYTLLDSASLANNRLLHAAGSGSGNYSIYSSLVFRYFILDNFKSAPLSQIILEKISADFATARKAGVKLIPRFTYTVTPPTGSCGSWICPPYLDAPKNIVLAHIAQLKPILQQNKDVLNSVQMGFIGVWGENFYTDYFGDASLPPYAITTANWADRNEVLDSLLAAVPSPINVQVRYPQIKQKNVYGPTASINSAPLTHSEAFQTTKKARLGHHNDCYLASSDDFGTYYNYDLGNGSDTTTMRPYKAADSKFVMVGGETCFPSAFDTCRNALYDMARMHYTYLNSDYNNAVNNQWVTEGCMEDIKKKLGYRLVLKSATFPTSIDSTQNLNFTIQIENSGFASPINPRNVYLILVNGSEEYQVLLPDDPRYWFTGTHTINASVCIPSCVSAGNYNLYLKLSDPSQALSSRPEYSIRTANTGTWITTKGYNNLLHSLTITSGQPLCASSQDFSRVSPNIWAGSSPAAWNAAPSNWSMNRIPDGCDDVVIPNGKTISVPSGYSGNAHSITVQSGGKLQIVGTGKIEVKK